jgi:hypothetical protein
MPGARAQFPPSAAVTLVFHLSREDGRETHADQIRVAVRRNWLRQVARVEEVVERPRESGCPASTPPPPRGCMPHAQAFSFFLLYVFLALASSFSRLTSKHDWYR